MIRHRALQFGSRPMIALCLAAGVAISGCTQIPELDATIPGHLRDAPYPELIDLDEIFDSAQDPRDQASEIELLLTARRARLQARAKRLNTSVIDPATRARMQDAIER